MTSPDTVAGDASLRLFCAFTLPEPVREALVQWQGALPSAGARRVAEGHLHVTLAFLGPRPATDVGPIAAALQAAVRCSESAPTFAPLRYRETRSVAMLVLSDEGGRGARVATALHEGLERLGVYRMEARPWLPHVTVLRFRRQPRITASIPDLPPFSPSEAAVYHSLLRRGGAQYHVMESVSLGG